MNEHERLKEQLVGFALGELPGQEAAEISSHVDQCDACRDELRRLEKVLACAGQLKELSADDQMCASAGRDVLLAAEKQETQTPRGVSESRAALIWRLTMNSPIAKLAAAAAIVVAAVFAFHGMGTSTPAFADIVRPILTAQTAVFRVVTSSPDQPAVSMEGMYMEPGLGRHTMNFGDNAEATTIYIVDYVKGEGLVLIPARKTAMVIEFENQPEVLDPMKMNTFKALRDRILAAREGGDENVEYLGESHVSGRPTVGYRFAESGTTVTIWAERDSLLPLQIEFATEGTIGKPVTVTMMDIQFDVTLDPAEFSTEAPEGYTVHTMEADVSEPSEVDLVEMLSLWVERTGKFPSALSIESVAELRASLREKGVTFDRDKGLADPAFQPMLKDFFKLNRSLKFVSGLPEDADWHYAGADVPFGDATTPIFWYRPEGSATYRVVYADLSVRDVAAEDLPQ
jgi:hypothetical protein